MCSLLENPKIQELDTFIDDIQKLRLIIDRKHNWHNVPSFQVTDELKLRILDYFN